MREPRIRVDSLAMGRRFGLEDWPTEFRVVSIVDEAPGPHKPHSHRVAVETNDWGILAFVFEDGAEVIAR
jgi:hypothetical protein